MRFILSILALLGMTGAATAQLGHAEPWQLGLPEAASPLMHDVIAFNNLVFWIIVVITLFVLGLLIWVMVRYNERANPKPAKFSHNTLVEVLWTGIPVLILVVIAIPSFKLLYASDKVDDAEMTLKVTGYQWYWGYEYPDHGGFSFEALMKQDSELKGDELRLLTTDNVVVLPVGTKIQVLVTAADVGHSWALPAAGMKVDGWPGRVNHMHIYFEKPGTYYGQCSELCGQNHGFMPIMIKAVSKDEFAAWVKEAQQRFGAVTPAVQVARATVN
ncbi:MAG: cytochrome c oxidase subunit II [Pseudomonadota bacterium]|nr:cytochrome c oxidase subunit II [Pseudomonadota bacterium]